MTAPTCIRHGLTFVAVTCWCCEEPAGVGCPECHPPCPKCQAAGCWHPDAPRCRPFTPEPPEPVEPELLALRRQFTWDAW